MKLADALALIANHSPEELRRIPPPLLLAIVEGMTGEEVTTFLFEKNVKMFGGINAYVDDFFEKDTVRRSRNMRNGGRAIRGTIAMLQRMQSYNHLSEENHARISDAIRSLESVRGGARKTIVAESVGTNAIPKEGHRRVTRRNKRMPTAPTVRIRGTHRLLDFKKP